MSPGSPPSRASVRRLLDEVLRTDAELDAFCLDHFPQVQRRFSEGMERVKKLNLLLQTESTEQILQYLLKRQPDARARLHEIESESASEPATALDPRPGSTDRLPLPPESQVLSRPLASVLWSTLSTARGLLRSALCLLFTAVLLWGAGSQPRWSPGALMLVGLALAASLGWLLHTIWQRWRIPSVSTTRFVGPLPMEEGDAGRFFGREAKIDELKAKLAQRSVRHILVFGVSGCGKTSLLRAGLIARLRAEHRFECVYLRFTDDPVGALQRALRAIGLPEKTAPADPEATLVGDLQQACTRSQLPILLCIDQFEEFQINPIGGDGFRQVLDLIWAISGSQPQFDNVKLVLSLREDFLSLLTDFYQDKGFAQGEEKVRVEPFEEQVAKEVIERLLHSESGGLIWDATLVRRVLDDLVFEKLSHGERRRYVLPTELQIVFQMVQSRRIYRDENYPGKKKLLLDYISEAIATVPGADPPLVKQLLLSLIDAGGQTKAKPQTLAQLANQVQADGETVRRILLHLDLNRHVVRSFHPDKPARTPSPPTGAIASAAEALHYELAHDYLAGVIRIVAGAEMSGAKRSQALVEMARLRAQDDPGYRMPILDCVQLWRYPAEQSTPEDRALLRRSLLSFGLRYCLPMLGLFLLASFIRFGTHTIRLQYTRQGSEVVLIRGIAALQPLLGAREPGAWTGLDLRGSGWQSEPSAQALVKELAAGIWRPSGLAFLRSDWDPDRYLRRRVAQAARPLAFPQGEGCLYTKKFDDEFAYLLLATSADLDQEVSAYAQAMDCGLRTYLSRCAAEVSKTDACTEHATVLKNLASLLGRVGARDSLKALPVYLSSRPSDAAIPVQALETLADLVENALPRGADGTSAEEATLLRELQRSIVQRMAALNAALSQGSSTDVRLAHDVAQLIGALEDSGKPTGSSIATLIDNPTLLPSIRDALIRALAQPIKLAERRSLVRALVALNRADPVTIGHFLAQLSTSNIPIQVISFITLLDMNPKLRELRIFFERLLTNTLSELKTYDPASVFPISEQAINVLHLFSGILLRCDEASLAKLMEGSDNPLVRFGAANYEALMRHYRRFKQAVTDANSANLASRYAMQDLEFQSYSKLLKLWDLVQPQPNILKILDSLTSQQGTISYFDKDIRLEMFRSERVDHDKDQAEVHISTNPRLRAKIESMIVESPASREADCGWFAAALRYNISNQIIHEKREIRQDDCYNELTEAIARYEILDNPTVADNQTLAHGVSKLRNWLSSPDGRKFRRYQTILFNGYRFLAQLLQDEPERRAAWIAQQRRDLTNNLRRGDRPLRQRLADAYVLRVLK